ncbi:MULTISPECIES: glycosyltransferase [unclassified Nostoc]|uniref:glycosyltransferase n=1 Tax=unclassified Nostoc TaxID=2593658 RepID=UPI001E350699|nr:MULTISPECIES: glycosyltransferase [unclassified Nostoc]MCC5618905.1 glycosyltransferase [Nostoc sp. CHAB 5836]MCC5621591.1 glycosyltransferase [Nostoc sp. CHAB 5715]
MELAMRVVMLGWEFPPFISGGLGTACYGLTKALDARGHEIMFVLPRPVDRSKTSHIRLLSPEGAINPGPVRMSDGTLVQTGTEITSERVHVGSSGTHAFSHARFVGVPAGFASPYGDGGRVAGKFRTVRSTQPDGSVIETVEEISWSDEHDEELTHAKATFAVGSSGAGAHYRGDLVAESERYARLVVALARSESFDAVHAHDWLTFPAGQALARVTGKPLIVHVHSTEFDRSGDNVHQRVYDIERRGMMAAMRVIAVSELTKSICVRRYGIPADRVDVVYNGIDAEHQAPPGSDIRSKDKIVLFLGRITMQKGPEYFIAAARRVLEKVPDAKFIMAGSGDMELRMIELAAHYGIGHRVLFTGFLRGGDVDRIYSMADCYVMPSVSEPFGIAPLEAMRSDVPVIISKQSGVSEVLTHALKVDFWDIDEMANKIVAVLRHPPLSQTLREHGNFEIKRLTWEGAAKACERTYEQAAAGQAALMIG